MDKKKKINLAILSLVPLLFFAITFLYEFILLGDLFFTGDIQSHFAINEEISGHYGMFMLFYGISIAVTLAVLLYFIVHLAKIKNMNGATKILWIVFLAAFMPISFIFFWYFQVNREPAIMPTKPNIA